MLGRRSSGDGPLSLRAFVATRIVGASMLAGLLACVVTAWMFWTRLSWNLRITLTAIPALLTFSLQDIRDLFMSYDRYRAEWRSGTGGNTRRRGGR